MAAAYRRDEVMVGALVLVAGAVLFTGLLWVGAFPKYGDTVTAVTSLWTIGGLPFPAPVKYAGHEIGEVTAVEYVAGNEVEGGFSDTAMLKVTMALRSDVRLPRYARATVTSASMLGDQYIEIRRYTDDEIERFRREGTLEANEIRREDGVLVIPAENAATLAEIQNRLNRVLADVQRFTGRLGAIGDTVERVVEGARRIVDDETFRENIHGTVASWRSAGEAVHVRVGDVADSATDALGQWRQAGATAQGAIARVGDRAETLVWRIDDIVARRGDTIAANFESFSERIANNPSSLIFGGRRPGRGAGTSSPTAY